MTDPRPTPLSREDLLDLRLPGAPQFSPDGRWLAYPVKTGSLKDNAYQTSLYLVPATGGKPRRLTYGKHVDALPRFSPDGKTLAFVSNRHEERQQVFLLPLEGGEARRLTDLDGSIGEMEWSPDGTKLVLGYRPLSEEQKARREAKKKGEDEKRVAFKVHTELHFKEDGAGFLFDAHQHLYLVDAQSGEAVPLTDGDVDDAQPAFSPDGKTIAFASNRMKDPLLQLDNVDVCTVAVSGGGITRITTAYGPNVGPAFSPDGKTIAFSGLFCEKGESFWRESRIWTVPVTGGEPKLVTPDLERPVGDLCISDSVDVGFGGETPRWSPDGSTLYFLISDSGSTILCRVPVSGGAVERLTSAPQHLSGLTLDAQGTRAAVIRSAHTVPAEVALVDLREGGEPRVLTGHNEALRNTRWIGEPEEFWLDTEPGARIQGWILKPPGFESGKTYPAILEIHGGPHVQYANTFFHEIQHLAGKGYVVLWTNPRGSSGYGEAHAGAIVKNWGGPDYHDVMAAVDHLVAQGYVDEARMGVTGGSYGGYMTNWIIGHNDRFKAAVTQRSVVNLYSFYGESDFGYDFEYEFFGRPWEDEETALKYLRMSPIHHVKNMNTPLLIIHSEEDHRCPISQAEELFTALRIQRKEVEFVRFEGESHGLSRGGRPQNRMERLKRIGEWFDRRLT